MSERKLKAWVEAGLIDAPTANNIRNWEASHSRPIALWALIGLGALAIGLGLISVVAANWDDIPGQVRLTIHMLLMAGLTGFILWRDQKAISGNDYFNDALLFIFGALSLTFFGHLGQVYQTSAPLWQPLLAWSLLISPLLLLRGRGWPIALMWVAAIVGTAFAHGTDDGISGLFGTYEPRSAHPVLYWGLIATPPIFAAMLATWMRGKSDRPDFWLRVEQIASIVIIAGASIAIIARANSHIEDHAFAIASVHAIVLTALAAVAYFVRRTRSGESTAGIWIAAALAHILAVTVSGAAIGPAICFMALWAAIAYGAIHAGWRGVFQWAVGILAIRLIILSFELADDLLGSGLGLIIVGLLTLGIAFLAVRISQKYAPKGDAS